jgi:hypothetical protein
VLTLFFGTSVNASNYDAMILEEVMRIATATFDDALTLSRAAYLSLTKDEVNKLDWRWTRQLVLWGSTWKEMHQERFNNVYRAWQTHQRADSLVTTFAELCRAHFQMEALLAVRNYRRTLLPVVTVTFVDDPDAMAKAAAVLEETEVATVRDAAFEGFPLIDVWERSPGLARAYMFAWFDLVRIVTDTKEEAVAEGQKRYAAEIQATDCDEQFARLGEQTIDEGFAPLFEELRSFYVSRFVA